MAGKLLQPLNHDYLPNLEKNVWPTLADPFYDKESRYTTPYVTYSTGIGWRTDMVSADIAGMDNPWEIFWNPEYKGITGLYDDYRDAIERRDVQERPHRGQLRRTPPTSRKPGTT